MKCLLLFFVGIMLSSCDWANTVTRLVENQSTHTNVQMYQNDRLNFELVYPSGWVIEEADPIITLQSFISGTLAEAEGVPISETKVDILPTQSVSNTSFKDYIIRDMSSIDCIEDHPSLFTLANGGQAVEIITTTDMGGTHSVIYADLEGRYFQFVTFGNLEPTHKIVYSLNPIKSVDKLEHQPPINFSTSELPEKCYQP